MVVIFNLILLMVLFEISLIRLGIVLVVFFFMSKCCVCCCYNRLGWFRILIRL